MGGVCLYLFGVCFCFWWWNFLVVSFFPVFLVFFVVVVVVVVLIICTNYQLVIYFIHAIFISCTLFFLYVKTVSGRNFVLLYAFSPFSSCVAVVVVVVVVAVVFVVVDGCLLFFFLLFFLFFFFFGLSFSFFFRGWKGAGSILFFFFPLKFCEC